MESPREVNRAIYWGLIQNFGVPTPWDIYLRRRVKKNPKIREYADAILVFIFDQRGYTVGDFTKTEEDDYPWVNTGDIVKGLCPSAIPHENTCYRLLKAMVTYGVLEKKPKPRSSVGGNTYYRMSPTGGFTTPIPPGRWHENKWGLEPGERIELRSLYKIFVQAEAARRVLISHGLHNEWINLCEAIAKAEEVGMDYSIWPDPQEIKAFDAAAVDEEEDPIVVDVIFTEKASEITD